MHIVYVKAKRWKKGSNFWKRGVQMQRFLVLFPGSEPYVQRSVHLWKTFFMSSLACISGRSRGKASCLSWAWLSFGLRPLKYTRRGKASWGSCLAWESKQVVMVTRLLILHINKRCRRVGWIFQPPLSSHWKIRLLLTHSMDTKSPEKDFGQQEKAPSYI